MTIKQGRDDSQRLRRDTHSPVNFLNIPVSTHKSGE